MEEIVISITGSMLINSKRAFLFLIKQKRIIIMKKIMKKRILKRE